MIAGWWCAMPCRSSGPGTPVGGLPHHPTCARQCGPETSSLPCSGGGNSLGVIVVGHHRRQRFLLPPDALVSCRRQLDRQAGSMGDPEGYLSRAWPAHPSNRTRQRHLTQPTTHCRQLDHAHRWRQILRRDFGSADRHGVDDFGKRGIGGQNFVGSRGGQRLLSAGTNAKRADERALSCPRG